MSTPHKFNLNSTAPAKPQTTNNKLKRTNNGNTKNERTDLRRARWRQVRQWKAGRRERQQKAGRRKRQRPGLNLCFQTMTKTSVESHTKSNID